MKIALIGRYGEGDILSGPERVARELYQQLKDQILMLLSLNIFLADTLIISSLKKYLVRKK